MKISTTLTIPSDVLDWSQRKPVYTKQVMVFSTSFNKHLNSLYQKWSNFPKTTNFFPFFNMEPPANTLDLYSWGWNLQNKARTSSKTRASIDSCWSQIFATPNQPTSSHPLFLWCSSGVRCIAIVASGIPWVGRLWRVQVGVINLSSRVEVLAALLEKNDLGKMSK